MHRLNNNLIHYNIRDIRTKESCSFLSPVQNTLLHLFHCSLSIKKKKKIYFVDNNLTDQNCQYILIFKDQNCQFYLKCHRSKLPSILSHSLLKIKNASITCFVADKNCQFLLYCHRSKLQVLS